MKIGKKILFSVLGVALSAIILLSLVTIAQFAQVRSNLLYAQKEQSDSLYKSNVEIMTNTSEDAALLAANNYSSNINSSIDAVSADATTIKAYLNNLYYSYNTVQSRFSDDMVDLQPGVKFGDVKYEFDRIKSVRDLMSDVSGDDNYGTDMYYLTTSGMILSGVKGDYLSDVDTRKREWYINAFSHSGIYWTNVYSDISTNESVITCCTGVFDRDGKVLGVLARDIKLKSFYSSILSTDSEYIKYSFIINKDANFLIGSNSSKAITDFMGEDILKELYSEMISKQDGFGIFSKDNVMVGYAPISIADWRVGVVIDKDKMLSPSNDIGSSILEANSIVTEFINSRLLMNIVVSIAVVLLVVIITYLISRRVTRSITEPIEIMTGGVEVISNGNLDYHIDVKSGDEIEILSESFNNMTTNLKQYINDLAVVTADRERISAELNIAMHIQTSMLPYIFPPFPERDDFDIYASMDPAMQVGGDFYDFFLIDDTHLGLVIADVSGDGIPAALFMVIARTLIKNKMMDGVQPKDVLEAVNNQLCENNEVGMFVTAFIGILEIPTGEFVYSNAGHNVPIIYNSKLKSANWLSVDPCFVMAGIKGIKYTQKKINISKGDVIYLYTDGVTEALNIKKKLFSSGRLKSVLNQMDFENISVVDIISNVKEEIDIFSNGAKQADDITMMVIRLL